MNQRKQNRTLALAAALLPILLLGILVASTGGALARYRADKKASITLEVRPLDQVYLGQMVTAEDGKVSFDPTAPGVWKTVDGKQQLEFTIANGTAADAFSQENQRVHLRLIGTLGIWDGSEKMKLTLEYPSEEDPGKTETCIAKVTRIREGSPMYTTFGDGWVFAFFIEDGEELNWLLEGGALNTVTMKLWLEGAALDEAGLLQLQISGVYAEE